MIWATTPLASTPELNEPQMNLPFRFMDVADDFDYRHPFGM